MGPFSFKLARLIGCGEYEAAITHLRSGLKGDASDTSALQMMADLYRGTGRSRDAIDLCRQSIAWDPQLFDAHAMLAQLLAAEGQYEAAAGHARTALETYPDRLEVPEFAVAIYRALVRVMPRLRSATVEDMISNPDASNIEWFGWAKAYLSWYEATFSGTVKPTEH